MGDARHLREHAELDVDVTPVDPFTFWRKDCASRIDCFYIPKAWAPDVFWLLSTPPPYNSDHQQVVIHLRKPRYTAGRRRHRPGTYSIQSDRSGRVLDALITELIDKGVGHAPSTWTWVQHVECCTSSIRAVTRREKRRRRRVIGRLRLRCRRKFLTRQQWISYNVEDVREAHLTRLGEQLESVGRPSPVIL